MSEARKEDGFEARLGRVGRRGLPEEWREEILGNACGERVSVGGIVRVWRSVPKLVALPVAACWVVAIVLRATMPGGAFDRGGGVVETEMTPESAREMFVTWVERKQILASGELPPVSEHGSDEAL